MQDKKTFQVNYYKYRKPRAEGITDYHRPVQGPSERIFSHAYTETWNPTTFYCPRCGRLAVWSEEGGGDFYLGASYLCIHCGCDFYCPSCHTASDEQTLQRLAHLRKEG